VSEQADGGTTQHGPDSRTGPTGSTGSTGPRVRTLVFGFLLALLSVSVLIAETTSRRVDGAAVAIGALLGAGVLLIVGAAVAAGRRSG
jgi:hypothetical protein